MALYALGDSKGPITSIPHRLLFDGWKSRLNPLEIQAIDMELDHLVQMKGGREVHTARWLSGEISSLGQHRWEGSPFMRIWDKACQRDRARTCWCFGLFVWQHMLRRSDAWTFKVVDLDGAPMAATRYCRLEVHNQRTKQTLEKFGDSWHTGATTVL